MAYFSPGKLHKSSSVKGLVHSTWNTCACVCANVRVGMHVDTSWVNDLGFRLVETLIINPQYILPPSLFPLIFKPQAALKGKFNPYISASFSFKSSEKLF